MSEKPRTEAINGLYTLVRGRHGQFLANPNDFYIGQSLIKYGEFSEIESRNILQFLSSESHVVEVGANIGAHSVPIANAIGSNGKLAVVELQPVIYQNLCANLALNQIFNTISFNVACGDQPGEIIVPAINYGVHGNYGAIGQDILKEFDQGWPIKIFKLDDLITWPRLDLIKIDVEGMEAAVIRGATSLIQKHRPIIYCENDRVEKSPELIQLLWSMDYALYWDLPPYFNPNNFFDDNENIYQNTLSFNMLCIPKGGKFQVPDTGKIDQADAHPLKR